VTGSETVGGTLGVTGTTTLSSLTQGEPIGVSSVGKLNSVPGLVDCFQFSSAGDMSQAIQACATFAYTNVSTQNAVLNACGFTGSQVWSINPFAGGSWPKSGTLQVCATTISVSVPIVRIQHWIIQGPAPGGVNGQFGTNFVANTSVWPTGFSTANGTTITTPNAYHTTFANSNNPYTAAAIAPGCLLLSPNTAPPPNGSGAGAGSDWGVVHTVTNSGSITASWGVRQGGGSAANASMIGGDCPLMLFGDGDNGSSGAGYAQSGIQDINISLSCGNQLTSCIPLMDAFGQELTLSQNIQIRDFVGIGWYRFYQVQNDGNYAQMIINAGASATGFQMAYVSQAYAGNPFRRMDNFTIAVTVGGSNYGSAANGCGTGVTCPAMLLQTANEYIGPGQNHIEEISGDGVLINPANTIAYQPAGTYFFLVMPQQTTGGATSSVSGVQVEGLECGTVGVANCVHHSNVAGDSNIAVRNLWTASGNSWKDDQNSCVDPASRENEYVTGATGTISYSTSAAVSCQPVQPVTIFFSCYGTAVSSSTIIPWPFNNTNNQSCATAGSAIGGAYPIPRSCTIRNLVVDYTAVGVGGDAVTVVNNGTPSAVTCAPTSGTSCSDNTHTASYTSPFGTTSSSGLRVQITTGAGDTLANVSGSFQCTAN
jgi:hypothetical protein